MITILIIVHLLNYESMCDGFVDFSRYSEYEDKCQKHINSRYEHGFPELYRDFNLTNVGTIVRASGTLTIDTPFIVK